VPGNYAKFALFLVKTILLTTKSYYFNYVHIVGASLLKFYKVLSLTGGIEGGSDVVTSSRDC